MFTLAIVALMLSTFSLTHSIITIVRINKLSEKFDKAQCYVVDK